MQAVGREWNGKRAQEIREHPVLVKEDGRAGGQAGLQPRVPGITKSLALQPHDTGRGSESVQLASRLLLSHLPSSKNSRALIKDPDRLPPFTTAADAAAAHPPPPPLLSALSGILAQECDEASGSPPTWTGSAAKPNQSVQAQGQAPAQAQQAGLRLSSLICIEAGTFKNNSPVQFRCLGCGKFFKNALALGGHHGSKTGCRKASTPAPKEVATDAGDTKDKESEQGVAAGRASKSRGQRELKPCPGASSAKTCTQTSPQAPQPQQSQSQSQCDGCETFTVIRKTFTVPLKHPPAKAKAAMESSVRRTPKNPHARCPIVFRGIADSKGSSYNARFRGRRGLRHPGMQQKSLGVTHGSRQACAEPSTCKVHIQEGGALSQTLAPGSQIPHPPPPPSSQDLAHHQHQGPKHLYTAWGNTSVHRTLQEEAARSTAGAPSHGHDIDDPPASPLSSLASVALSIPLQLEAPPENELRYVDALVASGGWYGSDNDCSRPLARNSGGCWGEAAASHIAGAARAGSCPFGYRQSLPHSVQMVSQVAPSPVAPTAPAQPVYYVQSGHSRCKR